MRLRLWLNSIRVKVSRMVKPITWVTCAVGVFAQGAYEIAYAQVIERVVWAEVTHVQPITQTHRPTQPARCTASKPVAEVRLARLLAWDLDPTCHVQVLKKIVAYDVEYHWDGRRYRQQMAKHPGDRVPLLIKIR